MSDTLPVMDKVPGDHLRQAMRLASVSAETLAGKLGVTPKAVRASWARGLSPARCYIYARALNELMEERGDIRRWSGESLQRGPSPTTDLGIDVAQDRVVMLRYAGEVPCGEPLELVDDGKTIAVLASWLERGMHRDNTLVMRAKGTSLSGAGVYDGDLVFVRTDIGSRDGDLVLVCTPAGCTLKRQRGEGQWGWLEAVSANGDDHEAAERLSDLGPAAIQGVVRDWVGRRSLGPRPT